MKIPFIFLCILFAGILSVRSFAEEPLQGHLSETRKMSVLKARYNGALEEMNYAYDVLKASLDKASQNKLQITQDAWQKYTEAECKFYKDIFREEVEGDLAYQQCLTDMTEARLALIYQYNDVTNMKPFFLNSFSPIAIQHYRLKK